MVGLNQNPSPPEEPFFYLDPIGMALPGLASFSSHAAAAAVSTSSSEDPSKKVRKPYTISKSRESWTEPEHDKFLEALQLFDRDWKKIEAFVGSKTVIQIRSHAQKYFMKVQKSGTPEHLPPPRPKRKAAHPYPQKASKNVPLLSPGAGSFQVLPAPPEPGFRSGADCSSLTKYPVTGADVASWTENSLQTANLSHATKGQLWAINCSSSTEGTPTMRPTMEMTEQGNLVSSLRVLPDFAQVYSFIGSVFDPDASDHLQKLTTMDPIDVETALLLMRNLSINLTSPSFEEHRRLLSTYEVDIEIESDEKGDFSAYLVQESPQLLT